MSMSTTRGRSFDPAQARLEREQEDRYAVEQAALARREAENAALLAEHDERKRAERALAQQIAECYREYMPAQRRWLGFARAQKIAQAS